MIQYKKATMDNAKFVYDLRFSDDVRMKCWTQEIPTYKEHCKYFKKHLHEYWIIDSNIGFVRDNNKISIYLKKEFREKKIGTKYYRILQGKQQLKLIT